MAHNTHRRAPAHRTPAAPHGPQPSRRLGVLAGVSMGLAVLLVTVPYPAGTNDTFMQILSGQYFWMHGLPHRDPFSYTAADQPWVDHEWLACLIVALVWHGTGVPGLVLWKTTLVGLTYWWTVQTARLLGARLSLLVLSWPCVVQYPRTFYTDLDSLFCKVRKSTGT